MLFTEKLKQIQDIKTEDYLIVLGAELESEISLLCEELEIKEWFLKLLFENEILSKNSNKYLKAQIKTIYENISIVKEKEYLKLFIGYELIKKVKSRAKKKLEYKQVKSFGNYDKNPDSLHNSAHLIELVKLYLNTIEIYSNTRRLKSPYIDKVMDRVRDRIKDNLKSKIKTIISKN